MSKHHLQFGIIADPIESFHPEAETTFFLLKEICRRGHTAWIMEPRDLSATSDGLVARATEIRVSLHGGRFDWEKKPEKTILLGELDCLLLRKDPPVDLNYLQHLSILELLERKSPKILFLNSPSGILRANEKLYPLVFDRLGPSTLVSADKKNLFDFIRQHRKIVVKPLHGSGGRGIFILGKGDPDKESLLEWATDGFSRHIMLQKFIPEAVRGDKRILLFGGEPLGAFLRVPSRSDFRGNLHSGARFVKASVTPHEKEVIESLKPQLLADGLFFVGIDFIGKHVTEINTTSPMGIREINVLYGLCLEKNILDSIESRLSTVRHHFPLSLEGRGPGRG